MPLSEAAVRRIFDGVREDVQDHLFHAVLVHQHADVHFLVEQGVQLMAFLLGRHLDLHHALAHEGDDVALQEIHAFLAVVQSRQLQQILDEAVHAVRFVVHDAQEAPGHVRIVHRAVHQGLRVALDRRERRLQLVRHVRHEVALHVLELLPFGDVLDQDDDADVLAVFVLEPVVVDREDAAAVGEDILRAVDLAVALDPFQADIV